MVDIEFVAKLDEPVTLEEMRKASKLEGMALLKKGQRLSVQSVSPNEWKTILSMAGVDLEL
jgi:predicted RNA-binding protein with PUA-like domain